MFVLTVTVAFLATSTVYVHQAGPFDTLVHCERIKQTQAAWWNIPRAGQLIDAQCGMRI